VVRGANQIKVKVVNKDPGYKLGVYYEKTDEEADLTHEFLIQICEPFGDEDGSTFHLNTDFGHRLVFRSGDLKFRAAATVTANRGDDHKLKIDFYNLQSEPADAKIEIDSFGSTQEVEPKESYGFLTNKDHEFVIKSSNAMEMVALTVVEAVDFHPDFVSDEDDEEELLGEVDDGGYPDDDGQDEI
jgi:hypothetical protein